MKTKECKSVCAAKKTSIGGQALIEGIMMRGPKKSAMAVRTPDGELVLEKWENKAGGKAWYRRTPILRGVFNFVSSMTDGYKCLMRSAELAGLEDAIEEEQKEKEAKRAVKAAKKAGAAENAEPLSDAAVEPVAEETLSEVREDAQTEPVAEAAEPAAEAPAEAPAEVPTKKGEEKGSSALMNVLMVVATVLGVVLAIGLFIMLPTFLYGLLAEALPLTTPYPALDSLIKSVFEGVLKIVILVVYMALVSRMKEIKRTFMYHGAEHKTIFCYENGKELTVENVRMERRFHPRCGTSFLILMLLVGIFVGFFIDPLFVLILGEDFLTLGWIYTAIRAIVKLLMLPLTMGIGYELIKLAGRHDNLFTRIISAPGLWLQRLTVLEPTDDMIECAITAFREVIPEDESDKF